MAAVEFPKKTPGSPGRLDKEDLEEVLRQRRDCCEEYESEQAASRADAGATIAGTVEQVEYKEFVAWGAKDEELLYSQRANLFIFEDGTWKKTGSGDARLLQHLKSKQVRLVMQEEGSMRLVANHFVIDHHPYCELQPCVDSKACWAWTAQDCSGDETKISIFALQLPSEDLAAKFKDAFDHAKELNAEVKDFMDLNKANAVQSTNGDSAASPPPAAPENPFLNLFSSPSSTLGLPTGPLGAPLPTSEAPQPPAAAEQQQQEDDGYVVEEEVTTIPGWSPSVTLEVKDQVETGEEQEEEVYTQRAKLYRFCDGEWKERGLGDAKLWKHKETGMLRFMLRQEKTMKIVANHYIIDRPPYCDLQPNAGSEKCWVWSVQDYAEDTPEFQRFALKFGNPDLAGKFKVAFNNAKEQNAQVGQVKEVLPTAASESAAPGEASPELVKNTAAEPAEVAAASATTTNTAGTPFSTTSVSASDPSGRAEGVPPASPFVSLSSTSGQPPVEPAAAAVSTDSKGMEPPQGEEECYVVEEEEEVTTIPGWSPSVHLEVRDHVETGEEDEEEIYSQRAKLYRFREGEWKERGLGEAKLLRHKETGKVRLMLRQEKTMKIVANHYVIDHPPYCDLQPNAGSEKCWVWMAQDVSDGQLEVERFAMKFGQAELANKFKDAFGDAKEQNSRVMDLAALGGEGNASTNIETPAASTSQTPSKGKDDKAGSDAAASIPKAPPPEPPAPPAVAASTQPSLFSSTTGSRPAVNPFAGVTLNTAPEVSGSFFGASSGTFSGLFSAPSGASTSSSSPAASATSAGSGSGLFGAGLPTAGSGGGLFTGFFNASATASSSGGGLFSGIAAPASSGAAPSLGGGLFSGILASSSTGAAAPSSSGGLFGGPLSASAASSGATTGGSLFGGLPSASSGATGGLFSSLFSGSSSSSTSTGGGLFSGVGSTLFGGSSSTTSSTSGGLFGAPRAPLGSAATSGGLFGAPASLPASTGGLFSTSANPPSTGGLFGASASAPSASTSGASFAAPASASNAAGVGSGGFLIGTSNIFSFSGSNSGGGLLSASAASASSSGSIFSIPQTGAAGGVQPASNVTATPTPAPPASLAKEEPQADEDQYVAEEEVTTIPGWAPSVTLEVQERVETGEENEEELYSQRSKLYRFRDVEWKERGTGEAKLLRHRETKKLRFLLRQEKTMKIVANHYVITQPPYCELRMNSGSNKCWVWTAPDCADGEPVVEQFALKFGTPELATQFQEAFNKAKMELLLPEGVQAAAPCGTKGAEVKAQDAADSARQEAADWRADEAEEDWEPYDENDTGPSAGMGAPLAALAAAQEVNGWRCAGCRLQWGEQVVFCAICEIPRPGFEEKAAAEIARKEEEKKKTMAAFLGTDATASPAPKASGFHVAAPTTVGSGPAGANATVSARANIFGAPPPPTAQAQFGFVPAAVVPPGGHPLTFNPSGGSAGFSTPCGPQQPGGGNFPAAGLAAAAPTPAAASAGFPNPFGAPSSHGGLVAVPQPPAVVFGAPAGASSKSSSPVPLPQPVAAPPPAEAPKMGGIDAAWLSELLTTTVARASAAAAAGALERVPQAPPPAPSGPPGVSEETFRKLEEQVGRLTERMREQEERSKAAEYQTSRVEDRAKKAEERARRAEEELEELRQQVPGIIRKQQEKALLLQQLQHSQEEATLAIENLKRDLKQERDMRSALEASGAATTETLQSVLQVANSALKVAEGSRQELLSFREENRHQRAEAADQVERQAVDALKMMELPTRISYLKSLHLQQTGRQLENGISGGATKAFYATSQKQLAAPPLIVPAGSSSSGERGSTRLN